MAALLGGRLGAALPRLRGEEEEEEEEEESFLGPARAGGKAMIEARRPQSRFADGLIREEVQDLWEPWMRQADAILQDEALLQLVYEALGQRAERDRGGGPRRKCCAARVSMCAHGVSRWWCARCGPTWSNASSRG